MAFADSFAIAHGDTFLLVGGMSILFGDKVNSIYEYESDSESWTTMPVKLDLGVDHATAVFVRKESFRACKN